MKRTILFLALIFVSSVFGIKNRYSESFIFTRPCYERLTAYEAFWQNMTFYSDCYAHSNMQLIAFFQNSIDKRHDQWRQYFLMRDRNELVVRGDNFNKVDRDIRAEWLGLSSGYNGTYTMNPGQEQFGGLFVYRRDLRNFCNWDFLNNFWVGAQGQMAFTKNKLNYSETTTDSPTIFSALSSPDFIYDKLVKCSSTIGITEIEIMVGAHFQPANSLQLSTRTGILFPFGNKYSGKEFYQAIRGYNRHLGLETTFNLQFPLNCSETCRVTFYADFQSIYLFQNTQRRTVDLYKKPYSRYLLFNSKYGQTNISGVNVLTPEFKVKPFNLFDVSAGFRIKRGRLEFQIGYDVWGHGNEELILKEKWQEIYGISAPLGELTPEGLPATASASTIKTLAPTDVDVNGDFAFIPIQEADLDLQSGISRGTFTNSLDGAIGWVHDSERVSGFVGAGGFIEIPMNNAALKLWGAWFKVGGSM